MADQSSTITLNIGTQRVAAAVFETSKSGELVLKAYDDEKILADPATDAARPAQIRAAISELVGRLGLKGKARYAISGQSVFIRFVKLPPLDDDNIEQLVTFEAQQHVPFPLEEVVWDYEILESGGEKEVVIVAIKGEALEEINEGVDDAGLGTAEVDVSPMALYNAFRAAYPDIDEPVLLIDVGAKTSDLLYIEGNRFFTRSANVGGAAVSTAIAKEFDVPFVEAEAHKTHGGLVALGGGHTEQLDEATAALAMCIRNAMTRLATEIPRTTNYYRSQHGGSAPKRVFLAGGGANLPYAKEFFEEKLRLPVDYFNPLPAITVGSEVDTERLSKEAHTMGELIGLGLRGSGRSRLNIDLVPAKVGEARAAEKRKPLFIAAAALLMLGALVGGVFKWQAANKAREEADKLARIADELQQPAQAIDRQVKKQQKLENVASIYVGAERSRTFWLDAFDELSNAFASEFVWITDMDPVAAYQPFAEKPLETPKSVVKKDFGRTAYGGEGLENVTITIKGTRPRDPDRKVAASVNALRLKGFWLNSKSNTKGQNVVYDLLARLQENAKEGGSHFKFSVKRDGKDVELENSQLVPKIDAAPKEGEYAAYFELILPLSREVRPR
ncbi:Amuc_1101 family PilM-like pilus complex protein [Haloferula sp. A504]|uniref:Amuc_1101 family PilM-like pilus complex protein n=1 Tax=Haloferula sp. A504 TaxID=3373601 RepID=UPI0031C43DAD|nr:type IV pilus assembly protein PilM [Verrucomicrobiaceae bacterium E54]